MNQVVPIITIDLFSNLDEKLISLLKSLSAKDWEVQTIAPKWKVKDVAAHLLDGNIRSLSMLRDGYFGDQTEEMNSYQDLVAYLNRLNSDWVQALKRVSPNILIELLVITGREYNDFLKTLDPYKKATFAVAWAGEQESDNWFHIAREYTEKWHHQQQIRLAVGQEETLYSKEYYFPYLDTSMRALPYHYRHTKGEEGEMIKFSVTGDGGGEWFLLNNGKSWALVTNYSEEPVSEVIIEGQVAWRMFTKGINRTDVENKVIIKGRQNLGEKIFDMLAVMA